MRLVVVVAVLGFILFLLWLRKRFSMPRFIDGIPGPTPQFFFGNARYLAEGTLQKIEKLAKEYGGEEGVCKYFYFTQPIVLLSNPKYIEHVFSDNAANYEKESDPFLYDIVGNGLLVSQGAFWKQQRRIMVPAFSTSFIRKSFASIIETAHIALKRWENLPQIDMREEMTHFTLDVICLASFSYPLNAVTGGAAELTLAITELLQETEIRVFQQIPYHKLPFSKGAKRFNRAKKVIADTLQRIIDEKRKDLHQEEREKEEEKKQQKEEIHDEDDRFDVLDRLLRVQDPVLTEEQLLNEAMVILLAGHETTANASTFALYLYAEHPDKAEKLKAEIDEVLKGETPTFQSLSRLDYLDIFVKESMRLYPTAAQLASRLALADDYIGNYFIPKGTLVEVWPWQVHRDPKYWKDPEVFRPERWHDDPPASPFSFIPFSRGPRSCIGQTLAIMETKLILAMVAQKYQLIKVAPYEMRAELTVTLRADDAILKVIPRNDTKY